MGGGPDSCINGFCEGPGRRVYAFFLERNALAYERVAFSGVGAMMLQERFFQSGSIIRVFEVRSNE